MATTPHALLQWEEPAEVRDALDRMRRIGGIAGALVGASVGLVLMGALTAAGRGTLGAVDAWVVAAIALGVLLAPAGPIVSIWSLQSARTLRAIGATISASLLVSVPVSLCCALMLGALDYLPVAIDGAWSPLPLAAGVIGAGLGWLSGKPVWEMQLAVLLGRPV